MLRIQINNPEKPNSNSRSALRRKKLSKNWIRIQPLKHLNFVKPISCSLSSTSLIACHSYSHILTPEGVSALKQNLDF